MNDEFFRRNAAGMPEARGLYDPRFEHDSCGVGFVVHSNAKPSHSIIELGIQILINLEHRGALGGDKSTGDGAGLLFQIPDSFFRKEIKAFKLPAAGSYGVGMVFLPKDAKLADRCRKTVEKIIGSEGCRVLGWREVPVESGTLGSLALLNEPAVVQIFLSSGQVPIFELERKLYVIRRLIEKEVASWKDADTSPFYICSLSSRTIVYKGLFTGTQLPLYFPDLKDDRLISAFSLVHQRYSTNTLPTWPLAQPFRMLSHNGEINTLRGNINRMRAREATMSSPLFGEDIHKIKPVLVESGSDSAILDNALELVTMAGRTLPHAVMMMIPEAFSPNIAMSEDKRAFYEFHSSIMEPWDGPAALVFTDGRYIGATLDRNGLRPARYTITHDGLIVLASETGVLDIPGKDIRSRGRLQPGKMFLVDLEEHRIVPDNEIKSKISRQKPYRRWTREKKIELRGLFMPSGIPKIDPGELLCRQHVFGYTDEELRMIISPMASRGQEPVGSMGNDAVLAVFSDRPQLIFNYFKQLFAQVTNPPIDPLREELVMSLESYLGGEENFLAETAEQYRGLKLAHPVLTIRDMVRLRESGHPEIQPVELDMLFSVEGGSGSLEKAMTQIFRQAEKSVRQGANMLILTDRNVTETMAPIPTLLVTSGLHHHMIEKGIRNSAGIIVESGEAREVMHFALLVGYGADAVCPYMAYRTIRDLAENGLLEKKISHEVAMDRYITAVKKGLLKTFSRMGISTVHSFFGSQIFECVGIHPDVVSKYFCGTSSRVGGIGLEEIAAETLIRHRAGYPGEGPMPGLLEAGGNYHIRVSGERHQWDTQAISALQQAVRTGDYELYKSYSALMNEKSKRYFALRGLLEFKKRREVSLEEVEPVENILKRFVSAAMSFGSISREAHEAVAIAMNRIGGRSNSGEGGEDPERCTILPDGTDRRSRIRQVASGRFGVTTEYLIHADEIQIKMAQGAKPGEGGQLPGHKVSEEIAQVRHTTPGVTLISPPPHHDIYSIEDLAQLIFDLKTVSGGARVSVKLVSETGVGTISSGVAKAGADLVLISGHDGGTGASPLTSIKHCGLPWELGLAEAQQSLIGNHLRDRIRVQVDGQLKTGRDLAIAALLGAEEYGFGTSLLIALGCVMMRKCHLNTCPVGVATQDETLRARFMGKADYVENFLRFLACEFREIMAGLGFRTVDEMVGRTDILDFKPAMDHWKAKKLDLSGILVNGFPAKDTLLRCGRRQDPLAETDFDRAVMEAAEPALRSKKAVKLELSVRNIHRAVGARLSGEIVKLHGSQGLPDDTIQLCLNGSAGQSLGAFLAPGVTIRVEGDANDYVCKGMSGGRVILVPPCDASFTPHENIIIGNVVLYGATGGEFYANGVAGERFAVRNSGATAVVEGVGDHGCEYMTGGTVVVLGNTGKNFAAGMSGGIAFVYDPTELFDTKCNLDMVDLETVWMKEDEERLFLLVENHFRYTRSVLAKQIMENWEAHLPLFIKVMPVDYKQVLERMRLKEDTSKATVSATEEVYR